MHRRIDFFRLQKKLLKSKIVSINFKNYVRILYYSDYTVSECSRRIYYYYKTEVTHIIGAVNLKSQ